MDLFAFFHNYVQSHTGRPNGRMRKKLKRLNSDLKILEHEKSN